MVYYYCTLKASVHLASDMAVVAMIDCSSFETGLLGDDQRESYCFLMIYASIGKLDRNAGVLIRAIIVGR